MVGNTAGLLMDVKKKRKKKKQEKEKKIWQIYPGNTTGLIFNGCKENGKERKTRK